MRQFLVRRGAARLEDVPTGRVCVTVEVLACREPAPCPCRGDRPWGPQACLLGYLLSTIYYLPPNPSRRVSRHSLVRRRAADLGDGRAGPVVMFVRVNASRGRALSVEERRTGRGWLRSVSRWISGDIDQDCEGAACFVFRVGRTRTGQERGTWKSS